ncbi:MAG: hypothetical protein GX573_05070 [Chloroflexi bacterium]|nr:hypothetical protein [Chloroflexota bacterium]
MNTGRLFRGVLFVFFFAFAAGCSSDDANDNTPVLQGVRSTSDSTEMSRATAPASFPKISAAELLADLTYEVVYVHDTTLFHFRSDMNQPEAVETGVHPAGLALSPDFSTLVFSIKNAEVDIQKLGILNLSDMAIEIIELPKAGPYMPPVVYGWSANSEWVVLSFSPTNEKVIILNVWTGVYTELKWYAEGERPRTLSTLWLNNDRLLIHSVRDVSSGAIGGMGSVTVDYYIFDPSTGERSSIELSEEALRSLALRLSPATLNTLDKELQSQGLALATPRMSLGQAAYYPDLAGAVVVDIPEQPSDLHSPPCAVWKIQYKPIREAVFPQQLYIRENVTFLSDLYLMPDSSQLVAQWQSPTCERFLPESLTVDILHISTDGTAEVVAANVSYGWTFDFSAMIYQALPVYARSNLYAVSPDGQYVAWAKRNNAGSAIMVTDLETVRAATLVELNHEEAITSVVMFRITE